MRPRFRRIFRRGIRLEPAHFRPISGLLNENSPHPKCRDRIFKRTIYRSSRNKI